MNCPSCSNSMTVVRPSYEHADDNGDTHTLVEFTCATCQVGVHTDACTDCANAKGGA